MPGMSGLDATTAIRVREAARGLPRTPIVAFTAHAMKGDRERCLRAGMTGYVAKPVEPEELFDAIERVGGETGRRDEAPTAVQPDAAVLDREAMRRRVGDDPDLLLEMVETFHEESAKLLDDIRSSILRGDADDLAAAAHTLKGALRTLSAAPASDAALQVELMAREGDLRGVEERWRVLEREMNALRSVLSSVSPSDDAHASPELDTR
jgi:HPt (histidine-containing phosphotransfer) domain-containing protein